MAVTVREPAGIGQTGRVSRFQNKVPPPILWVISAAVTWIVDRLDLDGSPLASTASEWIGVAIALVGIWIAFSGLREFSRSGTTSDPVNIEGASKLVTGGIYRFTRNPMYLGLTLISIGWAFRLGTAAGMAAGTGFLMAALTWLQIQPEEEVLTSKFGQDYTDYTQSVRRWL